MIFAGAGASTETSAVFPWTFYDEIHRDLGLAGDDKPSFPKRMSLFCQKPNGRRELLEKLRRRLSYVRSFPELYRSATRFHGELSTFFYVDTYITTNWDDYFEREWGATPPCSRKPIRNPSPSSAEQYRTFASSTVSLILTRTIVPGRIAFRAKMPNPFLETFTILTT